MRPLLLVLATLCLLGAPGCGTNVTTTVRLRDPRDVELRADDRTVLPSGAGVAGAQLASGSIPTGDFSSSAYEVRAEREASGALSLKWVTTLPVKNGERHVLVAPDGAVPLAMDGAALGLPHAAGAPSLAIPECGWLGYWGRGVYSVFAGQPCSTPNVNYRASLVTPWSNVVEVREERIDENIRNLALPSLAVTGLILLGVGDGALATNPLAPAVTWTLVSASVLLAIPLIYLLFRPASHTTVLYAQ